MYHVVFFNVLPGKLGEVPKLLKAAGLPEAAKEFEGVEPVGLFFPRGSGHFYAMITKCRDYATWEKWWRSPAMDKVREKVLPIATNQMDMFFDEIKIE